MIRLKTILNNSELKIEHIDNLSKIQHEALFEFEKEVFGDKYSLCPKAYKDFKYLRPIINLQCTVGLINRKIVSIMVYETISDKHYHCVMIATLKELRQKGLFSDISKQSIQFLDKTGVEHISLWTSENNEVVRVLSRSAELLNNSPILNVQELKLKQEYNQSKRKLNESSNRRLVQNFYKLNDGSKMDGFFWCYKLNSNL